jgi:4a-hydroxytetrahydrobiopterin dehydratase
MVGPVTKLGDPEIESSLAELEGWERSGDVISKQYVRDDFVSSVEFVRAIVGPAEELGHHPDLKISWDTVEVSITTHSEGGLTPNDFELARQIDELA